MMWTEDFFHKTDGSHSGYGKSRGGNEEHRPHQRQNTGATGYNDAPTLDSRVTESGCDDQECGT